MGCFVNKVGCNLRGGRNALICIPGQCNSSLGIVITVYFKRNKNNPAIKGRYEMFEKPSNATMFL